MLSSAGANTTYGLPLWALIIIGVGLVCGGIYSIVRFLRSSITVAARADTLIKLAAAAEAIQEALPVLLDIAKEFRPNSGKTLHDRLVRIDTVTSNTNATVVELHSYTHERVHAIVQILTRVAPTLDLVQRLAAQLGPTPKPPPNL